ncbi:uncharacterized protein JCM15063_001221 [Sporobolomyces koalae]|uniref:uncharacterized protein n=1 Tax=Sporobolomyces koalae TaxID=500713 RepID=UPI00317C0677
MAVWPLNWLMTSPAPSRGSDSPTSTAGGSLVRAKDGAGGATDTAHETTLDQITTMLEPFKAAGKLPVKARTDPSVSIKEQEEQRLSLARLWEYVPFFVTNGTTLTKAFVQHHLYGPPRPSWGVELTLFTTFLREVSNYSHLSSLSRLRSVVELGSLLPMPKDGIVTPISFKVKRRQLRGFLAEADGKEDGKREMRGEWVTNKRLWRKMTREWSLSKLREESSTGKRETKLTPSEDKIANGKGESEAQGVVCLYLHGGAYYMFSVETHRVLTIAVSRYCEARVFAINYRLAPETQFPGQLHDAVSAYMRLTIDLKIPPENIVLAGDSAGGGLVLATLMYLRDEGYPLPSGAILMSPWVDLTMSCESWTTNRPYDYLPNPRAEDDHFHPVKCLLGDSISEYLTHPYVSPLFGDFAGLPPLLIQAGDAEVLRDEITLLAHKASLAGVKVEHELFEDCVHVFQAFTFLEASRKSFQSQRAFVKHTLPRLARAARSSGPQTSFDLAQVDHEITQDAHEVDEQGKAEEASLPPTPHAVEKDLAPDGSGEGSDERQAAGADDTPSFSDDERLSDSTLSPDRTPPFGATESRRDLPSPRDTRPLTPNESLLFGASSADPTSTASAHTRRIDRPALRAYASARDLYMSRCESSESTILKAATTDSSHQSNVADSSKSAPASPRVRRSRGATITLSPRQATHHMPLIHSRSSSHPDFKELLAEYAKSGSKATTRVWGLERSVQDADASMTVESRTRNSVEERKHKRDDIAPDDAVEGIDVL